MEKHIPYGKMLDRARRFWNYGLTFWPLGGFLSWLGFFLYSSTGWEVIGTITLIAGITCVIFGIVAFETSLRWNRKVARRN